ncbi:MAG: preprotein translocase subunit SecG [Gemmatimonadetes bacterium]|nr:preprotein translocase subunit SecG [Gemmatimonadota bacterium]
MYGFILFLLIIDGLMLSVIVLMQSGKGDGLAAMGGGGGTMADSVLGGRQAATLLTKASWTTGAIFLVLAVVLSIMSSRTRSAASVLQQEFSTQPTPQPLLPGELSPPGAAVTPPATGGGAATTTTTNQ